ncbi:MAG: glycosyltransferase [Nitrospirae bacterium]|nr:glycosyltransferase [Nitrospirota bacterium]
MIAKKNNFIHKKLEKILVATATYNEAANIKEFVQRVRNVLGNSQEILVVDDNSTDGTGNIVRGLMVSDKHLHIVTRRCKMGIGSAHKMMMLYAISNEYDYLVTMDGDLSHQPEEIPSLLKHAGKNVFVIGSRYMPGGNSDYTGTRMALSRIGNFMARIMLGIPLREFTTSFRVFDVNLLKSTPIEDIKSNGYSFFVEMVSLMKMVGARLIEAPIHFKDRKNDVSKIPQFQVLASLYNLIVLMFKQHLIFRPIDYIKSYDKSCRSCGEKALLPLWRDKQNRKAEKLTHKNYNCSSIQTEAAPPVLFECFCCGLIQIPSSNCGSVDREIYAQVEDETYLSNFSVKLMTFRNAFRKIAAYLPKKELNILDIGSYYGAFLEVVKEAGHHGYGIEPSHIASAHSRDILKHKVATGYFPGKLPFQNVSFDLITTWDVLEHVDEPDNFIAAISELLPNDGLLAVSSIISDSFIAKILRKHWHWILPMHLTYFRKHQILDMLDRHGFDVLGYLHHTHYASVSYAMRGASRNMHPSVRMLVKHISKVIPASLVIPFSLGDVRMFICKKRPVSVVTDLLPA